MKIELDYSEIGQLEGGTVRKQFVDVDEVDFCVGGLPHTQHVAQTRVYRIQIVLNGIAIPLYSVNQRNCGYL